MCLTVTLQQPRIDQHLNSLTLTPHLALPAPSRTVLLPRALLPVSPAGSGRALCCRGESFVLATPVSCKHSWLEVTDGDLVSVRSSELAV